MRTLMFIVVGLLVAVLLMWQARPAARRKVAVAFGLAWLLAVLWNLRTGMAHGYSLQEEIPIQLLIFALPVAACAWWAWKARVR